MNIARDKNGASVRTHYDARFWLEKARKMEARVFLDVLREKSSRKFWMCDRCW